MKAFLQNLLIFFSLCLCALIAFQWVRETDLRKGVQGLTDKIHDRDETVQSLQVNLKHDEAEIVRLDGVRKDLTQTVKSNNLEILSLGKNLDKVTLDLERATNQVIQFKEALSQANEAIKQQNENIKKQNDEIVKMASERNEVVSNYNKIAKDFNELAQRWNKQQEDLAKAATNPPAPPPPKK